MKMRRAVESVGGFTVWDLLAIVAIGIVCAMLLLPSIGTGTKARAPRIQCISNLRQAALGIRMWASDHNEQYPFQVSAATNGSLEFVETPDVFRHFLAASNELFTPKILACPSDQERRRTAFWTNFSNLNLSYFIGLDAREETPNSILAGDRNITGGMLSNGYLMTFASNSEASFTREMHESAGNIVLADGSGAQCTPSTLTKSVRSAGMPTMRFAIPVVPSRRSSLQVAVIPALIVTAVIAVVCLYIVVGRKLVAQAASG